LALLLYFSPSLSPTRVFFLRPSTEVKKERNKERQKKAPPS
jgi:hypothetical protein